MQVYSSTLGRQWNVNHLPAIWLCLSKAVLISKPQASHPVHPLSGWWMRIFIQCIYIFCFCLLFCLALVWNLMLFNVWVQIINLIECDVPHMLVSVLHTLFELSKVLNQIRCSILSKINYICWYYFRREISGELHSQLVFEAGSVWQGWEWGACLVRMRCFCSSVDLLVGLEEWTAREQCTFSHSGTVKRILLKNHTELSLWDA